MEAALIGFAALLVLLLLRLPLAIAMGLVGVVGFYSLTGNWDAAVMMGARRIVDGSTEYSLSVIPLFVLMGNFVAQAGLSAAIFRTTDGLMGHLKGGQAMASVVASGAFSAICGSSLATVATMGKVSVPQMRAYGYSDRLATAAVAAGGTLGILIPPSVLLVVYGMLTETSIKGLFAAGLIPGIIGILFYVLAVRWVVFRRPAEGPAGRKASWREFAATLKDVWPTLILFLLVIGGIYGGIFTPTEAAAIGAMGAFIIALAARSLTWKILIKILADTARTTAMLFAIILTAMIFANFITRSGLPNDLLALVTANGISPMMVILTIVVIYVVLGCVLESMSMMLLTVPVFFPVMQGLGFDLIWFGILVVILIEVSLITPPVGMNVFVLRAVIPDVSAVTIFKGILPFFMVDLLRIVVVIAFPTVVTFLPRLL